MVLKVYSLAKLVFQLLPLSFLIGTLGAAERVIVDDTDPRIQYSGPSSEVWYGAPGISVKDLNGAQLLNGTAHWYGCGFIVCSHELISVW